MDIGIIISQIIWGLLVGVSYSLLAIGFSMIYASSGAINFAQGEYAMIGAYICFTIMDRLKINNIFLAGILSLAICFGLGVAIERIAFRRLYKLDHVYIVICTIGLSLLLKNLVLIIWGALPKALPITIKLASIRIGSAVIPAKNIILVIVGIVIMVFFHFFLKYTKFGTSMRAVAQNQKAASLVGINVKKSISYTWGFGSMIAGVGGILIAFVYNISIEMGGLIAIKGFAASILGGFGNIAGSMAGGVILGVIENLGSSIISYEYKDVIAFAILIILLIVKPSGIFIREKSYRKI